MMLRKIIFLILILLCFPHDMMSQNIRAFVDSYLATYPKARMMDIYKSCFQDCMGAEHLVSDRETVKDYLHQELLSVKSDELLPWKYEMCGINGRHVRVNISVVKDGIISEEKLLDAFIRSANTTRRMSVDEWRQRWSVIVDTLDDMRLGMRCYDEDRRYIDSVLAKGDYAVSHSPDFKKAYNPHYRIVERELFEQEIKPYITMKQTENNNDKIVTPDDNTQIEMLYKEMYKAMIAKDIQSLRSVLADDYVLIHMTGVRQSKTEYLRSIADGTLNYFSTDDEEIEIHIDGDKAVMTGRSRVNAAVYGGGRHTWRLQIKSSLVRSGGRWLFAEQRASTY